MMKWNCFQIGSMCGANESYFIPAPNLAMSNEREQWDYKKDNLEYIYNGNLGRGAHLEHIWSQRIILKTK